MDLGLWKDAIGFIGAIVMAIPFFRDQQSRKRRQETSELKVYFTPFAKALNAAEAQDTERLLGSSRVDMGLMLIGLVLLAISFAIGFIAGIGKPA